MSAEIVLNQFGIGEDLHTQVSLIIHTFSTTHYMKMYCVA